MPARSWLVGGGQVARLEIGWLEIGWWKPHWRPPAAKLRSFGASHRAPINDKAYCSGSPNVAAANQPRTDFASVA